MSCTILPTRTVEKVWGMDSLPEPFRAPEGKRIGEIWFEPPEAMPELLVKYIFASEKLSIQTHPDNDQTEAAGMGRQGKEECWLVIGAEPDARLAIGFHEDIEADTMRAAALDGSIEDLLVWHRVKPGDFFYIPANTVHAIGGGVSLIEVQQNSDITYRLYDYGRPRELHLEDGMRVAKGERYPDECRRTVSGNASERLVDGPFFRLDRIVGEWPDGEDLPARYLLIPVDGDYSADSVDIAAGQCALVQNTPARFDPHGTCLIASPL